MIRLPELRPAPPSSGHVARLPPQPPRPYRRAMRQHVVPEPRRYSVAEVLEFPSDGNRYEVVAGELLVSPAPRDRRQRIILRPVLALADYLRRMISW